MTTLFDTTLKLKPSAGERLPVRLQPPRFAAHSDELLAGLGYATGEIDQLRNQAVVA